MKVASPVIVGKKRFTFGDEMNAASQKGRYTKSIIASQE